MDNSRNPAKAMQRLIFGALRCNDAWFNELAMEALVAIGPDVVHTLVIEAMTSPEIRYRIRLLQVIEEISSVPDPVDHLDLFTLARDADPRIQNAAARALIAARSHQ